MIKTQILSQADKYALSLLDPDLIDFNKLEFDKDLIYLPIIISKLSEITEPLENDNNMFLNDAIFYGDMCFTYNPIDHTVEMLIAEHGAIQRGYDIASVMFLMKQYKHPDYAEYKLVYDKFNTAVKDNLKKQIREMMMDAKGEFVKDTFAKDTYFQSRKFNGKDIYYIIYRWWDKLFKDKPYFVDVVNGEGTVFVARNN